MVSHYIFYLFINFNGIPIYKNMQYYLNRYKIWLANTELNNSTIYIHKKRGKNYITNQQDARIKKIAYKKSSLINNGP